MSFAFGKRWKTTSNHRSPSTPLPRSPSSDFGDRDALVSGITISDLRTQGKLLVLESVIPLGNDPAFGKPLDINMLGVRRAGTNRGGVPRAVAQAGFWIHRIVSTATDASVAEDVPV